MKRSSRVQQFMHRECAIMTRMPALLALSALSFSGCATMTPAPDGPSPAATYLAVGTEPFWSLEVTPDRLNFNRLGETRILVPHRGWVSTEGGRSITMARIRMTVTPGPCSDGMSDRRFAETVSVTVDGTAYRGCGGGEMAAPQASLERSSWRIVSVNERPTVEGVDAYLAFAEGRVSGTAGCNRLTGPYTQERNQLRFGALAATRMACMGPRGEQESRVFAILAQPLTISFGERMTMTWTAADGSSISLRRLDWD